ncbi:MAG: alpha/beta fold hydrolase [Buchnera aphidicola (Periphyllus aceris)]|nr:alpha/beta fold hydrolase [Buchnera aphidicola (Periphyllus aceris)]
MNKKIKKIINIILINGLGFNKKVWYFLKKKFSKNFKISTIELHSPKKKFKFKNELKKFIKKKSLYIPKNCVLIGWSIGGLIATLLTLKNKKNILSLITISSSPCFIKKKNWPGMEINQIDEMKKKLLINYKNSIKNFFELQKNNTNKIKIKKLYKKIISQKKPNNLTIEFNTKILKKIDLRKKIRKIKIPIFRIYGNLDSIVPKEICKILDKKIKKNSFIFKKSNHAPFISDLKKCHKKIKNFIKNNI